MQSKYTALMRHVLLETVQNFNINFFFLLSINELIVQRYLIIYVWKILEGHVMNLFNPILSHFSPRRQRYCETSHVNDGCIGSLHFNSFRLKSCRLFNCLLSSIRNISSCSVQTFKRRLDVWIIFLVQCVVVTCLWYDCERSS